MSPGVDTVTSCYGVRFIMRPDVTRAQLDTRFRVVTCNPDLRSKSKFFLLNQLITLLGRSSADKVVTITPGLEFVEQVTRSI